MALKETLKFKIQNTNPTIKVDLMPSEIVGEWMTVTRKKRNNQSKNKGKNLVEKHVDTINIMHEDTTGTLNEVGLQSHGALIAPAITEKWVKKKWAK